MNDSYSDGPRATATITVNSTVQTYSVPNWQGNQSWTINVFGGDTITLGHQSGATPVDEVVELLDADGNLLHTYGPFPSNGTALYTDIVTCPFPVDNYLTIWFASGGSLSNMTDTTAVSTSPVGTSVYSYLTEDPQSGCTDTASIAVNITANDLATITTNQFQCLGQTAMLTSVASGGSWWANGTQITDSALVTSNYGVGTVQVVHQTNSDCPGSDTLLVDIDSNAPAPVTSDFGLCEGEDLVLNSTSSLPVIWYGDAALTDTLGYQPVYIPNYTDTASFWAQATTGVNCSSISVEIEVTFVPATLLDTIKGPKFALLQQFHWYSLNVQPGTTVNWTITNGAINAGQGSDSIQVWWLNSEPGVITAYTIDSYGCESDVVTTTVEKVPVGITELDANSGLQIQPNPMNSSGSVFIQDASQSNWKLRLLNPFGQEVFAGKARGNSTVELHTANLPAGTYFLQAIGTTQFIKRVQIAH